MTLAVILATWVLALSPGDPSACCRVLRAVLQAAGSQQGSASSASPQDPTAGSSPAQEKAPDQPASPPQTPAPVAPCPASSAEPGSAAPAPCKPASPAAARTAKKKRRRPAKAEPPPGAGPTKTVIRNGGTTDPTEQISQGLNQQQASHEVETTNQLLTTTSANLKKIAGRQLGASQQDTVSQIKTYMEQAKAAATSGDLQRAHNLALKANLLSVELAGP